LYNYEKMYASLKGKNNEEEAICLANIFKIKYMYIGDNNIKNLLELGKRCEFIVKNKNLDQNSEWYKEFKGIYNHLERDNEIMVLYSNREHIRNKYSSMFDEIDDNFNKRNSNIEFIHFILTEKPYPQYEEDKDKKVVDFSKESRELNEFLTQKYHPKEYKKVENDELSQLYYFLFEYIEDRLYII